jgi:enterochelin esterase-like enzyme
VGSAGLAIERDNMRRAWRRLHRDCDAPITAPTSPNPAPVVRSFMSATVPEPVGYAIARPPGAEQARALILGLPGRGERAVDAMASSRMAAFAADAMTAGECPPVAVAMVDGGQSYWHPRRNGEDRLTMLLAEFIPLLARENDLGSGGIALAGWSMGGYGALLAARDSPQRFRAVAVASPALFTSYPKGRDIFDDDADYRQHNVFDGIDHIGSVPLRRLRSQ